MNPATIKTVIQMANDAAAESEAIRTEYCKRKNISTEFPVFSFEDRMELFKTPRPKESLLKDYLTGLDPEELKELVTMMYVGRGDGSFEEMADVAKEWDKEACVAKLLEKNCLGDYLKKGASYC